MSEKLQFDTFLGGSQKLPPDIHILKLASARANEIAAMTYSIDNPQQTKLVFQKLPVHMRRRVMSHNAKRMPRRLREIHIRQMSKSGLPPKSKRPSRKYRRRPQNLLAEYKRRQANKAWLETHVWHAKRFHMVEKWGHKIPDHSNNRCFRSSYRAVAKHCLIQDISYYSCIQLSGPTDFLQKTLKQHCDPNGMSFAAKCYAQGSREGTLMFFRRNGYPKTPVGNIHFIWRPSTSQEKTIWLWAHPSIYSQVLSEICNSFAFDFVESSTISVPEYVSPQNCRLLLLKNSLNRFRLYGPLSLAVLTDALRLPELGETSNVAEKSATSSDAAMEVDMLKCNAQSDIEILEDTEVEVMDIDRGQQAKDSWHLAYYGDSNNVPAFRVQKEVFELLKDLKSPNQLPPGIVLAFTVLDPRFFVPRKRIKSDTSSHAFETIPVPPTLANISPIWDPEVREWLTENFQSTSKIDKLRSRNLVPGVYNDHEYNQNHINKLPILFIQRPGSTCEGKGIGFSSGIDVILPSGWAIPFWISFIFRCAKPGGLRESRSIVFENLSLNSPDFNPPDTAAYAEEALDTKYRLLEKYFKYPPNRRVNYVKLGISSPFICEWNLLVKEWTGSETNFYVLRDKALLNDLQENLTSQRVLKGNKRLATINKGFSKTNFKDTNCLVTVKISIENKGCPKDFAIICSPLEEDIQEWKQNRGWAGPVATIKNDPNELTRKELKRGHLALLRRLRRQRVRHREKMESNRKVTLPNVDAETIKKNLKKKARHVIDEQAERMKNLYLPKCETVRYSSDREVMGYVVKGDFSFTESKGIGLAYVTLSSLFLLIEHKSNVVLVRNTKSRQYRLARLSILR